MQPAIQPIARTVVSCIRSWICAAVTAVRQTYGGVPGDDDGRVVGQFAGDLDRDDLMSFVDDGDDRDADVDSLGVDEAHAEEQQQHDDVAPRTVAFRAPHTAAPLHLLHARNRNIQNVSRTLVNAGKLNEIDNGQKHAKTFSVCQ